MWHPWRALRNLAHDVDVHWVDQPAGRIAATDGRRVWMDTRLLQVQRRCAATHELIHIEQAHTSGCDARVEAWVRAETARRLITLSALVDALRWTEDWHEAADVLWVTVEVLQDRIDHLTPDETARLVAVYEETEGGA
ncbi:ImmA/IrrE family metallo-endopeptidase [Ruania suaedae]|uniref:ImmA/IrrE family metallo-endopeptidase n=1 Tax=Ruania suaedae TaxID=2897774 RepID=UPI001E592E48|nr:ImmA/IrrE family metallo-endopeptidase [Ruania suaedae]UFU03478.1 ImmA/IrrE family metallo-endopeptidase [Ruania suaedae]